MLWSMSHFTSCNNLWYPDPFTLMALSHLHHLTLATVRDIVGSLLALLSSGGAAHHFLVTPSLRHPGHLQSWGIYLTDFEWTSVFSRHWCQPLSHLRYLQEKVPGVLLIWLIFSTIPAYPAVLAFGCQISRELSLELTPCFIIQSHLQTLVSAGREGAGFTVSPNTIYLSLFLNVRMMDK